MQPINPVLILLVKGRRVPGVVKIDELNKVKQKLKQPPLF